MENVKVVIWGFGAMGRGMADMLLTKKGVEITGVCDLHPDLVGKSIFNALEEKQGSHPEVIVSDDIDSLLNKENCDVVLLATDSFTKKAFPKMIKIMEKGINVISTAEEMAYPQAQEPDLAKELNKVAKALGKASKLHKKQSNIIKKHIKEMRSYGRSKSRNR